MPHCAPPQRVLLSYHGIAKPEALSPSASYNMRLSLPVLVYQQSQGWFSGTSQVLPGKRPLCATRPPPCGACAVLQTSALLVRFTAQSTESVYRFLREQLAPLASPLCWTPYGNLGS